LTKNTISNKPIQLRKSQEKATKDNIEAASSGKPRNPGGEIEQHSGIQALMDPASNTVQTELSKINSIIKTGNYLPTDPDAARNYPWTSSQCYERYKLTRVTRMAYSPSLWLMAIGW
jgi:hypothetical protein